MGKEKKELARRDDELTFDEKTFRFGKMKDMVASQGSSGPCFGFMSQHSIVFSTMNGKTISAIAHNKLKMKYEGESTIYSEKCRLGFATPWSDFQGGIGFLKALYTNINQENEINN